MKSSKRFIVVAAGVLSLAASSTFAVDTSKDYNLCRPVKLIDEGRESIVTICEQTVNPPKDSSLRPLGRVAS